MNASLEPPDSEFRALSARLGKDPLQVQGPGGNTSVKDDNVMWIKASGTELAHAERQDIFVAVDRAVALAEAHGSAGDGSCRAAVLDPHVTLRPSIETTFHAALDHAVVVHTHSIATLTHAISPEGCAAARDKLRGLPFVIVPYAKPGLPLTKSIMSKATAETTVVVLQNHGLICCGNSVAEVSELLGDVEARLAMPHRAVAYSPPEASPSSGLEWASEGWMAEQPRTCTLAISGSYYPDHVIFLGPGGLPVDGHTGTCPAILSEGVGIALRTDASSSQRAMLRCLSDVLGRLPKEWSASPIGPQAEAELLNWDAEKYRQALASRQ
ncbi:MAG: class II aldolase/adducin family protein [Boseongicola sp.]|nr:class II aldolase/adducin family protein [Boseongicola sp.]MDE0347015.1 class II aldolase/adducin family protein [Boseongicola sp.]